MLVSYNWLKEYVDFDLSPQELADGLTMSGSEVDGVESLAPSVTGVITAKVQAVSPHPNADKLRVCEVFDGKDTVSVVCGAPNVAAGQIVPFATIGAVLPGSFKIKKAKLRGVESNGMICSERELGLSDEHKGIMVLPEATPLGVTIADALGLDDSVLELEIYPNRPDNLSVVGIAREVAAIADSPLRIPQPQIMETSISVDSLTSVTVEADDLCPRYSCRVIQNVKVGESPLWLQQRLLAAGMRPINNIVDVTNFVMLELGQPLHAFDYDLLAENRIVVRRAHPGETIVTLDGEHRTLTDDMLVIADGAKPQVIAGVMGAQTSEVSEATVNILLEAANFHGPNIRRTSRALGLRSEASHRFEKGLDPNATLLALNRAADLIAQLAGGQVAAGIVDVYSEPVEPWQIELRLDQVSRLLGVTISAEECVKYLSRLQLGTKLCDGTITVTVPTFRSDLEREADLVEEIGRLYGFDKIPATLPAAAGTPGGKEPAMFFRDALRDVLIGFGLNEAMTYTFTSEKSLARFGVPETHGASSMIKIQNPLNEEWSGMRTMVLPQLLESVERNLTRQQEDVHLFELGPVYRAKKLPLSEQPEDEWVLAVAMTGTWPKGQWGRTGQAVDVFDLKGILEGVAAALGIELSFEQSEHFGLHPGRTAAVYCQGEVVGVMGELHPTQAEEYSIPGRAVVAEINLAPLQAAMNLVRRVKSLPRYPAVSRDIALLVPYEVKAEAIEKLMLSSGEGLLQSIELFDVYQGEQIPENFRSLAFTMVFQAADRTLRDDEILEILDRIQTRLDSELAVQVRR